MESLIAQLNKKVLEFLDNGLLPPPRV